MSLAAAAAKKKTIHVNYANISEFPLQKQIKM